MRPQIRARAVGHMICYRLRNRMKKLTKCINTDMIRGINCMADRWRKGGVCIMDMFSLNSVLGPSSHLLYLSPFSTFHRHISYLPSCNLYSRLPPRSLIPRLDTLAHPPCCALPFHQHSATLPIGRCPKPYVDKIDVSILSLVPTKFAYNSSTSSSVSK